MKIINNIKKLFQKSLVKQEQVIEKVIEKEVFKDEQLNINMECCGDKVEFYQEVNKTLDNLEINAVLEEEKKKEDKENEERDRRIAENNRKLEEERKLKEEQERKLRLEEEKRLREEKENEEKVKALNNICYYITSQGITLPKKDKDKILVFKTLFIDLYTKFTEYPQYVSIIYKDKKIVSNKIFINLNCDISLTYNIKKYLNELVHQALEKDYSINVLDEVVISICESNIYLATKSNKEKLSLIIKNTQRLTEIPKYYILSIGEFYLAIPENRCTLNSHWIRYTTQNAYNILKCFLHPL